MRYYVVGVDCWGGEPNLWVEATPMSQLIAPSITDVMAFDYSVTRKSFCFYFCSGIGVLPSPHQSSSDLLIQAVALAPAALCLLNGLLPPIP